MTLRVTGLAAWWVQRCSALGMLVFLLFALAAFALHPPHAYAEWRGWVARPAVGIALHAFVAALLAHLWVGLRDVLLDYARPAGLRRVLLAGVAAGLLTMGLWTAWIMWQARG